MKEYIGKIMDSHHQDLAQNLGVSRLNPRALSKVQNANKVLEAAWWCAEQALLCSVPRACVACDFPEDFGGHDVDGPSHVVNASHLMTLNDAWRGAGFLCQLGGAGQGRPLGILANHTALHSMPEM